MMLKKLYYLPVLLLFFFSCSKNHTQKIQDIIQPINLEEGIEKEIVISDIFYAPNYNLTFSPNPNVTVNYDSVNNIIKIKANEGFTGLDLLEFTFENQKYDIPFKLEPRKKYLFTYKPKGKHKQVNLFGQFNSWDRNSLPMSDEDGNGIYKISVPLDPGRYEYKFYVDGAELIDPRNPVPPTMKIFIVNSCNLS